LVEAGRVCIVNYGPTAGRLCVIINVIDSKTALVDGPKSINGEAELKRHVMPLKRLSITNIKCNILPGARVVALEKAITDAGVVKKWAASSWAKGIAKKKAKANMSKCRAIERA
jgi:large subunit ribosomal protein L14e